MQKGKGKKSEKSSSVERPAPTPSGFPLGMPTIGRGKPLDPEKGKNLLNIRRG
jgi:hypothetical protein